MGMTILIRKARDANYPANLGPITLTSVIYRIINGNIAQHMISNGNRSVRRDLFSISQKGFVPRVNGCGEYIAVSNMAINRAMTTRKVVFILAYDMHDAFGSFSHV
jgi:hypothetical protein